MSRLQELVGFIGLGAIGSVICRRILRGGYPVVVHDIRPEAVAEMEAVGATTAASPAEVGGRCRLVLLCLPDHHAVRDAALGRQGLVETLPPGSLVVDLSTCHPEMTRETARLLGRRGIGFIDAPVSGGVAGAREGTLTVMAGGEAHHLDRVKPVLSMFGSRIIHVGNIGSGHTAKAINNLLSAANLLLGSEAVILGQKAGIDPGTLIEVINCSSGRNQATEVKFPRHILNRRFDAGFTVGILQKDVHIATSLAASLQVPLFTANVVRQLYDYAVAHGFREQDGTAMICCLEQLAGIEPVKCSCACGDGSGDTRNDY